MLFAIASASFGCINAMLHQTLPILGQLWRLFEVSQILEFLRYIKIYRDAIGHIFAELVAKMFDSTKAMIGQRAQQCMWVAAKGEMSFD